MRIRVLLVDDDALVRAGFRMILESQADIEVVGEAGDGREAIEAVERLCPDVVLMDIEMPNMDGLKAAARLAEAPGASTRVVMLTTFRFDHYVDEALVAGVSGFLFKNASPEELIQAVQVVAAGEALLAPSITRRLIREFPRRARPARPHPDLDRLTRRELEVLRTLARGMTTAEIARELFVSEATVKTHISHVLTKLGLSNRAQAIAIAHQSGLAEPDS